MTESTQKQNNLPADVEEALQKLESKYDQLVWYARKPPADDHLYWNGVPDHFKEGALNACSRIEEVFPEEVSNLKDAERGGWQHGFNSGMLAALRFCLTATQDDLEKAREMFPCLDT